MTSYKDAKHMLDKHVRVDITETYRRNCKSYWVSLKRISEHLKIKQETLLELFATEKVRCVIDGTVHHGKAKELLSKATHKKEELLVDLRWAAVVVNRINNLYHHLSVIIKKRGGLVTEFSFGLGKALMDAVLPKIRKNFSLAYSGFVKIDGFDGYHLILSKNGYNIRFEEPTQSAAQLTEMGFFPAISGVAEYGRIPYFSYTTV
jgi:uncharacterized protein (UPF0216 family)